MSLLKPLRDRLKGKRLRTPPSDHLSASQHIQQGWARRNENDLDGAVASFSKAISLESDAAEAYYGRGVIYCTSGRLKQAIADLDKAVALSPNFAQAYTECGLAYEGLGELTQAMANYEQAIAIDPAYVIAYQNRGAVYARQGNWTEALANFDLALRLNPQRAENYLNRARAFESLGNYQRAIEDLETYLEISPKGPYAEQVEHYLQQLQGQMGESQEPAWSVQREMWTEFTGLSLQDSVNELIRQVQEKKAHYVVIGLPNGQYGVSSVYARDGLRPRLTEIADVIGPSVLDLRLGQFLDQWYPCIPVEPDMSRELATRMCEQSWGRTVVIQANQVIGVLDKVWGTTPLPEFFNVNRDMIREVLPKVQPDYTYPSFPTVLFGKGSDFQREGRPYGHNGARQCGECDMTFAYYDPVLDGDMLTDYACPHCGASPIHRWVEIRMQPGEWSQYVFLGEEETLEDVVDQDARTLERLGVTYEQIADALDRLLHTASAAYEKDPRPFRSYFPNKIDQGELPPEHSGFCADNHQVFLQVYMGYKFCPWAVSRRPWSSEKPSVPVEITGPVITIKTGQRLSCQSDLNYSYGDRRFVIVNRANKEYLRGSGLIVHLIRDHHFFAGRQSPCRVEPDQAARVLGLI